MGPIKDTLGVEQGGMNSDSFYKLINNEQLLVSQNSALGAILGDIIISAIGQADDVVLLSNNIFSLKNLLYLNLKYCDKYMVQLVPDKTKLQVFLPKDLYFLIDYFTSSSPLEISSQRITFSPSAEHVGVIRSPSGNLPNLLNRFRCHNRALGAILSSGLARKHRANPAAALQAYNIHCVPVLMSGLSYLVLKSTEINSISLHHKKKLLLIQKLPTGTPDPVVYFLSGSLPGRAILHLRQLSNFGMITHLSDNPIYKIAMRMLTTAKPSSSSWFLQIRDLCLQYSLPHPLVLLKNPIPKAKYKTLIKKAVQCYWQERLCADAASLVSLSFFRPSFMSLSKPHPLWATASSNPYEVNKAVVQAKMLSGRYRTESLSRFWSNNPNGFCILSNCLGNAQKEDIIHILVTCPSLSSKRTRLKDFFHSYSRKNPVIENSINSFFESKVPQYQTQFLLDCSVIPEVVLLRQNLGLGILSSLFYLTRTWCYSLHRERLRQLGRWNLDY